MSRTGVQRFRDSMRDLANPYQVAAIYGAPPAGGERISSFTREPIESSRARGRTPSTCTRGARCGARTWSRARANGWQRAR